MLKFIILMAAVAVCYGQSGLRVNQYLLFTKRNPTEPEIWDPAGSPPSNLVATDRTLILVHGHGQTWRHAFNTKIRVELLNSNIHPDHNIIVVDWSFEAGQSYAMASASVESVAQRLSEFINELKQTYSTLELHNVHFVGFGLGAHVIGIAARILPASLGSVGRITGLDPSGNGWGSNSARLRSNDALYVEVIHTDGSGLGANGIGTSIGDIDFFVNGGSNQPGCFSHSCSHERAWDLFAATMLHRRLEGKPCSSMVQMNLNLCRGHSLPMGGTDIIKQGESKIYRVNTARGWPY